MNNLPEPTKNEQENLSRAGHKNYSAAIHTGVIGGIVSCLFALIAIGIVFTGHSDSPGLDFYIFGFLAIVVLIISGIIVIVISLAGAINYATALSRNKDGREESINGITKSISLILGIVLALLIVFKLLNII